MKLNQYP